MPQQNPAWTDEELVLALDLYLRHRATPLTASHEEVIELSRLLNQLSIHPQSTRVEPFRDPDGVRRRVTYFAQIDRGHEISGREAYKRVWCRYSGDAALLGSAVRKICGGISRT